MSTSLSLLYPLTYKDYKEFYGNREEVEKTKNWETFRSDTMDDIKGTINGKPLYQTKRGLNEFIAYNGSLVRRSRCNKFLAILPQHEGEEDDPVTPYNLHHVKHSISPNGIFSPCHVMVIPNPDHEYFRKRRYANAMTLTKDDIPMLDVMEELLNNTIHSLIDGPSEMIGSLRWWISRKDSDMVRTSEGMEFEKIDIDDFKPNLSHNFNNLMDASRGSWEKRTDKLKKNISTSFQLASRKVNWLTMHGWINSLETINYEKMERESIIEGNEMLTSSSIVRMFIHSNEINVMKQKLSITRLN